MQYTIQEAGGRESVDNYFRNKKRLGLDRLFGPDARVGMIQHPDDVSYFENAIFPSDNLTMDVGLLTVQEILDQAGIEITPNSTFTIKDLLSFRDRAGLIELAGYGMCPSCIAPALFYQMVEDNFKGQCVLATTALNAGNEGQWPYRHPRVHYSDPRKVPGIMSIQDRYSTFIEEIGKRISDFNLLFAVALLPQDE